MIYSFVYVCPLLFTKFTPYWNFRAALFGVRLGAREVFVGGTFHGLDKKYLQAYLNEVCYRFNRRNSTDALFYRLLVCCAVSKTITFSELTDAGQPG